MAVRQWARASGAKRSHGYGDPRLPSFRVSNARIKRVLGWASVYPTYRISLAAAV